MGFANALYPWGSASSGSPAVLRLVLGLGGAYGTSVWFTGMCVRNMRTLCKMVLLWFSGLSVLGRGHGRQFVCNRSGWQAGFPNHGGNDEAPRTAAYRKH